MDAIRYTYLEDRAPMPRFGVEPQIDELIKQEMSPSKHRRLAPPEQRKRKISELDSVLERWQSAAQALLPEEKQFIRPATYQLEHWRQDALKRQEDAKDIQRQNDHAKQYLADCGAFLAEVMKDLDLEMKAEGDRRSFDNGRLVQGSSLPTS
mmetsp:Transcript_70498/g.155456  ORF Transcript_70498/g.155456 Transcript_70498/m.155456 type:complete len:152 (+) Transcript_70498:32-487(+)